MIDFLPSWTDSKAKQTILNFVRAVTDISSPDFTPPAERVATFDNDGTLWCEKPTYIQLYFSLQRLKELSRADASLLEYPAYKAAAADDLSYFAGLYPDNIAALIQIIFDSHANMSQSEFQHMAYEFLSTARHPRFNLPFKQCIYQPMVELLHFVRDHGFKVFIASAGGMSFVRSVSEEIYDLPRENVIGSNIKFKTAQEDGRLVLLREAGLIEPIDDGPGKPVNIELHIGRPPILAVGNANGDLEMMQFAQSSGKPFLNLLLRHDDADREYAYDHGAEKIQQAANQNDWTMIRMQQDWKTVFARG